MRSSTANRLCVALMLTVAAGAVAGGRNGDMTTRVLQRIKQRAYLQRVVNTLEYNDEALRAASLDNELMPRPRVVEYTANRQILNPDDDDQLPGYERWCGGVAGASWQVPFGSYRGGDLLSIRQTQNICRYREEDGSPEVVADMDLVPGTRGFLSPTGGWDFEEGSHLKKHLQVIYHTTSRCAGGGGAGQSCYDFTDCGVTVRYTYDGPDGTLFFTSETPENVLHFKLWGAGEPHACLSTAAKCATEGCRACPNGACGIVAIWNPYEEPQRLRSTEGNVRLELSNGQPTLRRPDGSFETFAPVARLDPQLAQQLTTDPESGYGNSGLEADGFELLTNTRASLSEFTGTTWGLGSWVVDRVTDRNGNWVRYEYDSHSWLKSVSDWRGHQTTYVREGEVDPAHPWRPTIVQIKVLGIGGNVQTTTLGWKTIEFDPKDAFPGITAHVSGVPQCSLPCTPTGIPYRECFGFRYRTLESLKLPDGRSYRFEYLLPNGRPSWGALSRVALPTGGEVRFTYAGPSEPSFTPEGWNCRVMSQVTDDLLGMRLLTTTTSAGDGSPDQVVTVKHLVTPTNRLANCFEPRTTRVVSGDGSVVDTTLSCAQPSLGDRVCPSLMSLPLRVEKRASEDGPVLESTEYFPEADVGLVKNNPGTLDLSPCLDGRMGYTVYRRDGQSWAQRQTYEPDTLAARNGVRTTGNVARTVLFDENNAEVSSSDTRYLHGPGYDARHLVRLPLETVKYGADGSPLARMSWGYDAYEDGSPKVSGAPVDRTVGAARGNVTSAVTYLEPDVDPSQSPTWVTTTEYWDTGDVYRAFEPAHSGSREVAATVSTPDFSVCAPTGTVLEVRSSVQVGMNEQAKRVAPGWETRTYLDCHTGAVLATFGVNDERTCTQYDAQGRIVAVAYPGDSLDGQPTAGVTAPMVFLPACLGSTGPGTWTEYPTAGQQGPVHTVSHAKDKTRDGLVSRAFTDGLGRLVQSCTETVDVDAEPLASADPGSTEAGEMCTHRYYDSLGRMAASSSAFFRKGAFGAPAAVPDDVHLSHVANDALGRVVRTWVTDGRRATIDELGQVSHGYATEVDDGRRYFVVTMTGATGLRTKTYSDVKGLTAFVKAEVSDAVARCEYNFQSVSCACGADAVDGRSYCKTAFAYDRAERLSAIIDPFFNRTEYEYDAVGRRIWMKDPDTGESFFEYGIHGLLASSDSKRDGPKLSRASYGRTTLYGYDLLGRLVVQDAPVRSGEAWVNGPDDDDEIVYFDGHGTDSTCYGCDLSVGRCALEQASCSDGAHWGL